MKSRITTAILSILLTSSALAGSSEGQQSIGEKLDNIGDYIFSPLDLDTYTDPALQSPGQQFKAAFFNTMLDLTYLRVYGDYLISKKNFHQKITESKTIISNKTARPISTLEVSKILDQVKAKGVTGNQRIFIVLESMEHGRSTIVHNFYDGNIQSHTSIDQQVNDRILTSKNQKEFLTNLEREAPKNPKKIHTKNLIIKEITKDELKNALAGLSKAKIQTQVAKVANVKLSGARILGSGVAVYLTLDLAHNLLTDF